MPINISIYPSSIDLSIHVPVYPSIYLGLFACTHICVYMCMRICASAWSAQLQPHYESFATARAHEAGSRARVDRYDHVAVVGAGARVAWLLAHRRCHLRVCRYARYMSVITASGYESGMRRVCMGVRIKRPPFPSKWLMGGFGTHPFDWAAQTYLLRTYACMQVCMYT